MARKDGKMEALIRDDMNTLVRDLYPDLELAIKAVNGNSKGKLTIEAEIVVEDGEVRMTVTGKATHPKLSRADRKLFWVSGQLELFEGPES
jgi:hypothetical protein